MAAWAGPKARRGAACAASTDLTVFLERRVVRYLLEPRELIEISDPAIADGLGDEPREPWVRLQEPGTRGDSVRHVPEPVRPPRGEVGEQRRPHQAAVEQRDAVHGVAADKRKVRPSARPWGTTPRRGTSAAPARCRRGTRPPAPLAYRRSLLERLGIGRILGPSGMMVVREIERRPLRSRDRPSASRWASASSCLAGSRGTRSGT
jgi:hypothetical protein